LLKATGAASIVGVDFTSGRIAMTVPSAASTPEPAADQLPDFRYPLEESVGKTLAAGSAKQATVKELPVSENLAGVSMWLEPGAVRELHWHANAAEWGFVVAGSVRVTLFDPKGRIDIADAGTEDVFYFRRGYGHAIQNTATEPTHFILIFDNGHFSEFATFSSTDWTAHTPIEVLSKSLNVPPSSLAGLPKGEAYIVPGPAPPPLIGDRPATLQPLSPLSHTYRFSAQPIETFPGGTIKIVTAEEFPASTTISGALIDLEPGGLREPHWHPNAAEWFYILAGQLRVTLFGSQARARTETFNTGDVGYIPQGYGHYLENVGNGHCRILLGFNDGDYQQISLSGWLAANPRQLVASNFTLPLDVVDKFPDTTVEIAGD
jgi:oxalate decarboxylase